jgi:hypothetical protein
VQYENTFQEPATSLHAEWSIQRLGRMADPVVQGKKEDWEGFLRNTEGELVVTEAQIVLRDDMRLDSHGL